MNYEFRVRNWERFQHYKKRTDDGKPARRPNWIKVYTKLLDDPAYRGLSGVQRGLLHDLWIWWARMDLGETYTGLNVQMFNAMLATTSRISTWKALETAGFIELRASSDTGDIHTNASPEVEEEKKQPLGPTSTEDVGNVVPIRGDWNGHTPPAAETLASYYLGRQA